MGASSSSNGARPPTSISASEHEAAVSSTHTRSANDKGRQRAHQHGEDQPRLQLTYAARMTGWQSADGHGPPMCQPNNNEVMELSRIVSQLAMANHQLASAHSATLTRMETLYLELSRDRDDRKRATAIADLAPRLEQRVARLENLLAASAISARRLGRQRCSQVDDESRCDSRGERPPDDSPGTRETRSEDDRPGESPGESSERASRLAIDEAPEEPTTDHPRRRTCLDDAGTIIPQLSDDSVSVDVDLDREWAARLGDDRERASPTSGGTGEDTLGLSEEIERLRADRLERRSANDRLPSGLADRRSLTETLSGDYEELKARHVDVEADLHAHRQRCDELTERLDSAERENARLLKENDTVRSERDTAEARISVLEQELQRSLLEKEQIKNTENQKTSKLRAQLSEEVSDKKKQIKALEDALQEIQRLKETVKTERRSESDVASREDIESVDATDDPPQSTSDTNCSAADMEEFKKDLALKREARHRAIAAVSSEMERLRRELDAEKEAHYKTLALLRSARGDSQSRTTDDDRAKPATKGREERMRPDDGERESRRAEAQRLTNTLKVSDELRNDVRHQIEKVDDLRYHLETDPERHRHRIRCLTEATSKARESLRQRERQTNELKDYLAQVLVRLGDRSFLEVRDDAGAECNRQLENINALKCLYNERLRVFTELRDSAIKELADVKQKQEYTVKRSENLEEELRKTEEKVDAQASEITTLESQLGLTKADCRDLQNQMSLINGLFTQMLLGATSADMDLDRLTQLLQENHDLISDIAREESTEAAALPKLLLDLVEQVEGSGKASQRQVDGDDNVESNSEIDRKEDDLQEEDIAHNLPKVWRVLLELLSCHAVTSPTVSVASCLDPNSCYKSVDTPAGPTLVISVSKTYIRLKELILEKKHLEKEMNRMKQLNVHLESKLGEQEKRLSMVSTELTKTWDIVGRMQAQHQQLHTHEEILRYELQEKRKMLQELKQELEYCREKWESARQKNTNTELEWRNLRREFAARKALTAHDSFCSAESGFSDEKGDDTDEEEETIEGRIRHGPRRRTRKSFELAQESPRAPTPDTESEQPTDTELSESKTGSSAILEQRTPTPETEAELDEVEVADVDSEAVDVTGAERATEIAQETLDPLDQALANVIQNLIRIDDGESNKDTSVSREDTASSGDSCDDLALETSSGSDRATALRTDFRDGNSRPWCSSPASNTLKRTVTSIDLPSIVESGGSTGSPSVRRDTEAVKSESVPPSSISRPTVLATTTDATSVFSIGPLPAASLSSARSAHSDRSIASPPDRLSASAFAENTSELENPTDNLAAAPCAVRSSSATSSGQGEESEQRASKATESVADSDSISVDSSSSLDTVREFPATEPSASVLPSKAGARLSATVARKEGATIKPRTPEEVLAARADRLKRLEEQADWLVKKMSATSRRGTALCTRLEELHETHGGEPPVPPPMPDVLPSRRLPSSLPDLPRQAGKWVSESSSSSSSVGGAKDGGESSGAVKDDKQQSDTS